LHRRKVNGIMEELETSESAVSSLLRSGGGVAYMDAAILDDITIENEEKT